MERMNQKVGIVGLGLIGASLAKRSATAPIAPSMGWTLTRSTVEMALAEGTIAAELTDLGQLDVLIVALFPQATVEYIQENAEKLRKGCLVMDICGVKKQVADRVAPLCKSCGVEYIGAHPMAGRERWGYQNSTEDLFDNASIILTPIFTDSWALRCSTAV